MKFKTVVYILGAVSILFQSSCSTKARSRNPELNTPLHHITSGNMLLKSGRIEAAKREFNSCKELDPTFSPAYTGLGLVHGFEGDFKQAFSDLEEAERLARDEMQRAAVHVGFMRIYIMGREIVDQAWLNHVEEHFDFAIEAVSNYSEAYFFMGLACKMSYQFQKAAKLFDKVIEIDKEYVKEAAVEYEIIQKIERSERDTVVKP